MDLDFHYDATNACLEGMHVKAKYFTFCCCCYLGLPYSIDFDLLLFHFRDAVCDLRVQLPGVALEHAKISRSENREVSLYWSF